MLQLAAVEHYLSGKVGFRGAGAHFGAGIQLCTDGWRLTNFIALPGNRAFLARNRLNVVMTVINDKLSIHATAARFNPYGESAID
ncbi:hypothetical protein ACFFJN_18310 [Erwinia mallotivora]|uniref:hypothetical protein n=1 Tax=Erwinia mallotivora TaxID=69222 RepID=UPI0035F0B033